MVVGIVVGMFGKGGIVAVGKEGMFGKDGSWVLGLGRVGKGLALVAGQPEAGNGGILVGSVGNEGPVCNRWRAARVMSIPDIDMAMISKSMNTDLVAAIFWSGGINTRLLVFHRKFDEMWLGAGMFGKDGMFGNDGIWLLGLGIEDKGLVGNVGSAA
ncbi:LOW QUALITY PROTEIN: hypothetical protein Cgig2_007365 [Carnegiea gigantea]|uniref:Uncharacterized protein n=1 Tax=Carnegiea gigantea TaxID=171969 RepID=A0A9Q1KY71_9CARY|nr:LOW QUALITY PROTEIN: hypothetical protein Cgig2_002635 [Carnegiea gigantea]KAJ8451882.1 LOW QUALITY PROTEIN: hypothetical protein Cgig2_007365 [Carnegiea gigantea]